MLLVSAHDWHCHVVNDLPLLQLLIALLPIFELVCLWPRWVPNFAEGVSMSRLSNLLSISNHLKVLPRDILVPSPTNASIQAIMPASWFFFLISCMFLSRSFNVLLYSSKFSSPPQVCGKLIERTRIFQRTTRNHLVFLRQSHRSFEFFFLTAITAFPLLSARSIPTPRPCHLLANSVSPETSLHWLDIEPYHAKKNTVQKICAFSVCLGVQKSFRG